MHRALVLLDALAAGRALGVSQVAQTLGIAPSSAHRLLSALVYEGHAVQAGDLRYRAGPRLRRWTSANSRPTHDPVRAALPEVLGLIHDELGETLHVWRLVGPEVHLLTALPGTRPEAVPSNRWPVVPAYTTAGGRSLLAQLPNQQVELLYAGGLPAWPRARIASLGTLKRRLGHVRRVGFSINIEEGARGSSGVAVPVVGAAGEPILALAVAVPSRRFDRHDADRYEAVLHAGALTLSAALTGATG